VRKTTQITTLLFLIGILAFSQDNLKYAETINIFDLEKHLRILASDSLEGRETGKPGQKMAAAYIANHFKELGLPACVETVDSYTKARRTSYYQKFKIRSDRLSRIWKKKVVVKGENVLGYIKGTDLKNELIVISAHYDHLGKKDSLIFNGADDNASGTAAIMEIAQAFMIAKKEGKGPRRSVLIIAFSGEEKGLLGSKYYTDNPVFSLEKTVANLNIDMIGRLDDLHQEESNYVYLIGADRLSQELHDISERVNEKNTQLDLDYRFNEDDDPNRYYYRSDHYNFAKNNIPVIFYFNGVHEDYHKATDTIEKIDYYKTQKITKLIFLTAWELANKDERLKLNETNEN
tara:strand:+ start:56 stop:1096 length:1041 start_codon:yes stop_codon:yes gene_type:complete